MTTIEIAKQYFDCSNESDFKKIAEFFTPETIYLSANTGNYRGVDEIMNMQRAFHGKFSKLNWKVNSVSEIDPNTVCFDFSFSGILKTGEQIVSSGLEYITVKGEKILQVKIEPPTLTKQI